MTATRSSSNRTSRLVLLAGFVLAAFLVAVVGLVGALDDFPSATERDVLRQAYDVSTDMTDLVEALASVKDGQLAPEQHSVQLAVERQFRFRHRLIVVVDQESRVIADGLAGELRRKYPNAQVQSTLVDGKPRSYLETPGTPTDSQEYSRRLVVPLRQGSRVLGALILDYTDLYDTIRTENRRVLMAEFAATLLAIGAVLVLGVLVSRYMAEEEISQRLKGEFLANMSHEIRTPLHAILGMTYLALRSRPPDRLKDYLSKIQMAGQSLLHIVNDILDMSKVEAGKVELEKLDFLLDDVLDNVVSILAGKASERGLELVFRMDSQVPAELVGDPQRLGQVLLNLVGNAIKFTERGEVLLAISLTGRLPMDAATIQLCFQISDTGIGMTASQLKGLFTAFHQADSSITRTHGGTGLGLAICKQLAHLMQGEIQVDSSPGQGTTFRFTATFGISRPDDPGELPNLGGLRAVVSDENATARGALAAALRNLSVAVTEVETPELAQALLERDPLFDLVFLEQTVLGLEALCRCADPSQNISLISMARHGGHAGFPLASGTVLLKPFTQSRLLDTLADALGRPDLQRRHPHTSTQALPLIEPFHGVSILVVEDNPINQQIARELLESVGLRVDIAGDGGEAVERVLGSLPGPCPWDVVLMDLQMPEMDGYTAAAAIRRAVAFQHLPILAMSAHVLTAERERCEKAGMNGYISKPIDPEELFNALRRWIPTVKLGHSDVKSFPQIVGLDVVTGLDRLAGNEELYRSLLLDLSRLQDETVRDLKLALAESRLPDAMRLAHLLQGAAGNLGANSIQASAAELEGYARHGKLANAVAALITLEESTRALSLRILAALESPAEVKGPISQSSVVLHSAAGRATLLKLGEELAGSDGAALETLHELLNLFDGRPPLHLDPLTRLVRQFDFDLALIELQGLKISEGSER